MKKELVSIIIPTYSRAEYINRAIESVLSQTYSNIEIVVVDDNGEETENQEFTQQRIEKYRSLENFKYIIHKVNKNGAAARNTGIKNCEGNYITFLDDDDELLSEKIEKQVLAIKDNDEYAGVYSGFQIIHDSKIIKKVFPSKYGNLQLELLKLRWGIGTGSNPLFKREVFKELGGFDESFIRHQDLEFLIRFFRHYKIAVIPDLLINRYVDHRINTLNPRKYIVVKEKFLHNFQNDIELYPENERNEIYRNQYSDVGFHAAMKNDIKFAISMYKKANEYKIISIRDLVKVLVYYTLKSKVQ